MGLFLLGQGVGLRHGTLSHALHVCGGWTGIVCVVFVENTGRRGLRKLLLGLAFPVGLGARVQRAGRGVVEPLTVGATVVVTPRQDAAAQKRTQSMLGTTFGALSARHWSIVTS